MQKTIQNDLLQEVEDAITTNHTDSDTGCDWTAIQSDLSSLMSGLNLAQDHDGPALEIVLQATHEERDDISIAVSTLPKPKVVPQTGAENKSSQAFQALLKMVDLEKYQRN